MSDSQISVVICQAQGRHPVRRALEEQVMQALIQEPNVHVTMVPHLYDMTHSHSGMEFMRSVPGNLVVLGWLYERAIHWTLDRAGIRGQTGESLLKHDEDDEEPEADEDSPASGIGSVDVPDRRLYCIDLRASEECDDYVEEVRRILGEEQAAEQFDLLTWIQGSPTPECWRPDRLRMPGILLPVTSCRKTPVAAGIR